MIANIPSAALSPDQWSRFRPVCKASSTLAEIVVPADSDVISPRRRRTADWRLGFGRNGLICVGETINDVSEHFEEILPTFTRAEIHAMREISLLKWEGTTKSGYCRPVYVWPSRLFVRLCQSATPTIDELVQKRIFKS